MVKHIERVNRKQLMKKYIITEEEIKEILRLVRNRQYLAIRDKLNGLEELKEKKKEVKDDN